MGQRTSKVTNICGSFKYAIACRGADCGYDCKCGMPVDT